MTAGILASGTVKLEAILSEEVLWGSESQSRGKSGKEELGKGRTERRFREDTDSSGVNSGLVDLEEKGIGVG
jgi:hypothetical protein